jgi:uncharacterized protein (TIGR02678 family)
VNPLAAGPAEPDERTVEERRQAARLLLARPLVGDSRPDAEGFALVRRHAEWLRAAFDRELGYRLVVETELARLHKRPAPLSLPRPLSTRSGRPFDARRYALFCLILAALERVEIQTTLATLAEEVALVAASEPLRPLDLDLHAERQAFVDAARALVELGILRLADGDDVEFVEGRGDALYDVDGRRLAQVLTAPVPSELSGPYDLEAETYPRTDEGTNRRLRHRLARRLVEEPVLYLADLDDAERAYWTSQRSHLVRRAVELTGLEPEVRREGAALIDGGGRMTDAGFPGTGTVHHAALLLAERLVERAVPVLVPFAELRSWGTELLARYGRYWSRSYRDDPNGSERLVEDALGRLEELGLVLRRPEGIEPRPALARYRLEGGEGEP